MFLLLSTGIPDFLLLIHPMGELTTLFPFIRAGLSGRPDPRHSLRESRPSLTSSNISLMPANYALFHSDSIPFDPIWSLTSSFCICSWSLLCHCTGTHHNKWHFKGTQYSINIWGMNVYRWLFTWVYYSLNQWWENCSVHDYKSLFHL